MSGPVDREVQDATRDDELPDLGEEALKAQVEQPEFKRYRTLVNLNGLGAGEWIEIDPEDPAWWGAIEAKFIIAEVDWMGPQRVIDE